jgi:rRNA processing protein Krr1/Pno1
MILNMFNQEIIIPEQFVGLIIGKNGETIKRIRRKFGVDVIIVKNKLRIFSEDEKKVQETKDYITKIYSNKNNKSNESCPICLENLTPEVNYVKTECGHAFHFSCLSKCLSKKDSCPLCRTKINSKGKIDEDLIIQKTIMAVRSTNYAFYLMEYPLDIYSYQLTIEEFLKEPIRYALRSI